jgi:hypothetical protein
MGKHKKTIDFIVDSFIETGKTNLTTEEEGLTFEQLDNITEEQDIIEMIADYFYKKKMHYRKIGDELNIEFSKVKNYLSGRNPKHRKIMEDFLGCSGEQYNKMHNLRALFYKNLECIEWDEQEKTYEYPSFPTIDELENLLTDIRRDRKWASLYKTYPCLFKRNKRNVNTVNKIKTIMSLDGYGSEEIDNYVKYIESLSHSSGYEGKVDDVVDDSTGSTTYESSFTKLNCLKSPENKGKESMIHNLQQVKYKLGDIVIKYSEKKYKRKDFIGKQSDFIIKNISDYISNSKQIIKYDLEAASPIKDINGGIIIERGGKIEVKDISKQDSYFAEFLASPVKHGMFTTPQQKKYYTDIIKDIFTYLYSESGNDLREKIIELIRDDLSGMIIANNIYVPNKPENIEFYMSYKGRNNPTDHFRLTVRYKINMGKWESFYRLGDGEWVLNDGTKSKKCVLYPLKEKECLTIKSVTDDYITFDGVLSEEVNSYITQVLGL